MPSEDTTPFVSYLLRVLLPDRPGALGAVASRIGAVKGNVVSVVITERDTHYAADEFVIDLPPSMTPELLAAEVREVDGVIVEQLRLLRHPRDPRDQAYTTASALLQAKTQPQVWQVLVTRACLELDLDWAGIISRDLASSVANYSSGIPPDLDTLSAALLHSPTDNPTILCLPTATPTQALTIFRRDHPLHQSDCDHLQQMLDLAETRIAILD